MIIGNDIEAIMYIRNYQKNDLKNIIFLFQEISMDKSLVAVLVRLFWPGTC